MKKRSAVVTRYEQLQDWLSVGEVSRYLRLGKATVYGMVLAGTLAHKRIGRRIIVPRTAVGPKD